MRNSPSVGGTYDVRAVSNKAMPKSFLPVLIFGVWVVNGLKAQEQQHLPSFEVASVKPMVFDDPNPAFAAGFMMGASNPPCSGGKLSISANRLRLMQASVCDVIRIAWDVKGFQVIGAPTAPHLTLGEALNAKSLPIFFYDIEAKARDGDVLDNAKMREMLRSLLADRFHLEIHRDKREMTYYALLPDKNGPKPSARASAECKPGVNGEVRYVCDRTMEQIVRSLSSSLDHAVMDMTGYTGTFQYHIPPVQKIDMNQPDSHITIADQNANARAAIADQIGFKIESRKGPVAVIVVDHVSEPSPN